jgi:hypothetical protein
VTTSSAEHKPQPPDIGRRTLTPFGYAVCVVVPIVIAAVGFTVLHFNYDPEDVVTGTRVPVLTSNWKPGDPGGSTTLEGVLTLGDDDCVSVVAPDGTATAVVWPFDFEATYDPATSEVPRRLKLYDIDRTIAARSGDTVRVQGESADVGDRVGEPCAPPAGTQVFEVESPVAVTARG